MRFFYSKFCHYLIFLNKNTLFCGDNAIKIVYELTQNFTIHCRFELNWIGQSGTSIISLSFYRGIITGLFLLNFRHYSYSLNTFSLTKLQKFSMHLHRHTKFSTIELNRVRQLSKLSISISFYRGEISIYIGFMAQLLLNVPHHLNRAGGSWGHVKSVYEI